MARQGGSSGGGRGINGKQKWGEGMFICFCCAQEYRGGVAKERVGNPPEALSELEVVGHHF